MSHKCIQNGLLVVFLSIFLYSCKSFQKPRVYMGEPIVELVVPDGDRIKLVISGDTTKMDSTIKVIVSNPNSIYDVIPSFPWPPPRASSMMVMPSSFTRQFNRSTTTLGSVSRRITEVLESCGYVEKSFFAVPDGFALVTRLEQYKPDGAPMDSPHRWDTIPAPMSRFSLGEYLSRLFFAKPGLFRIVVFVVSPHAFNQTSEKIDEKTAIDWLREGANKVPASISEKKYSVHYAITALVYEFKKTEGGDAMQYTSTLTCRDHLIKSGILK